MSTSAEVEAAIAFLDKASKLGDLVGFEVKNPTGPETWRGMWGYGKSPEPTATAYGETLPEAIVALAEAVKRL